MVSVARPSGKMGQWAGGRLRAEPCLDAGSLCGIPRVRSVLGEPRPARPGGEPSRRSAPGPNAPSFCRRVQTDRSVRAFSISLRPALTTRDLRVESGLSLAFEYARDAGYGGENL
jgi:hypothetical protein